MNEEQPRQKKLGPDLLRNLVRRLQAAFYPETLGASATAQRPFYQDLRMLRMAATWPAKFIRDNGTGEFDAERYEEIFAEIVRKVKLHGPAPEQMRRRGAYVLKAVQDHWRHNWETYQPESKTAARRVEKELAAILARGKVAAPEERAVPVLAAVYDALTTGRPKKAMPSSSAPKRKPVTAPEIQAELF